MKTINVANLLSDGLAYLLSFFIEGDAEMACKIIFSDVDGTLLNSEHQLLPETLYAIRLLQQQKIPFVIVSARSPSGIYPIQEKYEFKSPIISYSGSLILDENKTLLWSKDVEMLETVGNPFLMGNAPDKFKKRFTNITDTNDENGIYHGLIKLGLISERY